MTLEDKRKLEIIIEMMILDDSAVNTRYDTWLLNTAIHLLEIPEIFIKQLIGNMGSRLTLNTLIDSKVKYRDIFGTNSYRKMILREVDSFELDKRIAMVKRIPNIPVATAADIFNNILDMSSLSDYRTGLPKVNDVIKPLPILEHYLTYGTLFILKELFNNTEDIYKRILEYCIKKGLIDKTTLGLQLPTLQYSRRTCIDYVLGDIGKVLDSYKYNNSTIVDSLYTDKSAFENVVLEFLDGSRSKSDFFSMMKRVSKLSYIVNIDVMYDYYNVRNALEEAVYESGISVPNLEILKYSNDTYDSNYKVHELERLLLKAWDITGHTQGSILVMSETRGLCILSNGMLHDNLIISVDTIEELNVNETLENLINVEEG